MPKLFNKRRDKIPKDAIYIGRPSKWGNPFILHSEYQREEILIKYLAWIDSNPKFKAEIIRELKGRDLVCWCSPKLCHGDVLIRIANEDYETSIEE